MVKLRLVRLNFCKISIVKVSRTLEFIIPKYDDPTALVTYCQEFSSFIKRNGC